MTALTSYGLFASQVALRTMWQEVLREPEIGQRAVAHVIANRLHSGRWGHGLAEVLLYPLAFSGWNAHDSTRLPSARLKDDDPSLVHFVPMLEAALDSSEPDMTGGATHYYNPKIVGTPLWVKGDPARHIPPATPCGQFGAHLFFKNVA